VDNGIASMLRKVKVRTLNNYSINQIRNGDSHTGGLRGIEKQCSYRLCTVIFQKSPHKVKLPKSLDSILKTIVTFSNECFPTVNLLTKK
jgi:hypothetical protein